MVTIGQAQHSFFLMLALYRVSKHQKDWKRFQLLCRRKGISPRVLARRSSWVLGHLFGKSTVWPQKTFFQQQPTLLARAFQKGSTWRIANPQTFSKGQASLGRGCCWLKKRKRVWVCVVWVPHVCVSTTTKLMSALWMFTCMRTLSDSCLQQMKGQRWEDWKKTWKPNPWICWEDKY